MEKVIEILKKHKFEETVAPAARIFKSKETDKTDEEILEDVATDYIRYLLCTDQLTNDEDDVIIHTSERLLAKEVLKALNISSKIDEPNAEEQLLIMFVNMMKKMMK